MARANIPDTPSFGFRPDPNSSPTKWVRFKKEEQQNERAVIFIKNRRKRYFACDDLYNPNTIDAKELAKFIENACSNSVME